MIAGEHKTNDFSMAIHEHWIPPVWIHNDNPLFTGNPELANVRGQNKWLFNGNPGQVKPSCCPLHGKARLRCTEVCCTALHCVLCTRVRCIPTALAVAVYWQCIGHFRREWLRFTGGQNSSPPLVHTENWTAMITAHIWPPKGKKQLFFSSLTCPHLILPLETSCVLENWHEICAKL